MQWKKSFLKHYLNIMLWGVAIILTGLTVFSIVYCRTHQVNHIVWFNFWKYFMTSVFFLAIITSIFLVIGSIHDIKKFFKLLREEVVDETDDGYVRHKSDNH